VILSSHRLTGYWFTDSPDDPSKVAATEFLDQALQELNLKAVLEGETFQYYDPEHLDKGVSGYDWLRARLCHLKLSNAEAYRPGPQISDRDPFPAFFWRIKSLAGDFIGLLEVLVGRDIVVFHQMDICEVEPERDHGLCELQCALFFGEFTQVSDLTPEESISWSDRLGNFVPNFPPSRPFLFHPGRNKHKLMWGIRRNGTDQAGQAFEGLVILQETTRGLDATRLALHLEASGFIVRLSTLLANISKVELCHSRALENFPELEIQLQQRAADLEARQRLRVWKLPEPLSRSDIEALQFSHSAVWEITEYAGDLVDTSIRNTEQFETFSYQLLHEQDLWVRQVLLNLHEWNRHLRGLVKPLERKSKRLHAAIELAMTTGRLLADESVPELVQFRSSEERKTSGTEGFPLLVVVGSPPAKPTTIWSLPEAPAGEPAGRFAIRRPDDLKSDQRDDLTKYYLRSLWECSSDDLRTLITGLSSYGSILRLTPRDAKTPKLVEVGNIFNSTLQGDREDFRSSPIGKVIEEFLPESGERFFCEAYENLSMEDVVTQDCIGFMSLLSFLEAVVRIFEDPPDHLAKVAREHTVGRSQFLFLLSLLYGIARQFDVAKDYCYQSVCVALRNKDRAWAYFAAQIFRKYEQPPEVERQKEAEQPSVVDKSKKTVSKPRMPQEQPWQNLALDFLSVYDVRSAVGLARRTPGAPLRRPMAIRVMLWGLALLVGASLLTADHWLLKAPEGKEYWLGLVCTFAILGAPLALGIGARGALKRFFPNILYPKVLGAITLATITFCDTEETGALASAGPLVFSILIALSLGGGALYLYSEVKKKVGPGREGVLRCMDIFSLAFLEATLLSTIFTLVYGKMLSKSADDSTDPFMVGEFFLRPRTIFLVAMLSMLIGIVVQLMFQPTDKPTKDDL
jgi:hypothetical protein